MDLGTFHTAPIACQVTDFTRARYPVLVIWAGARPVDLVTYNRRCLSILQLTHLPLKRAAKPVPSRLKRRFNLF